MCSALQDGERNAAMKFGFRARSVAGLNNAVWFTEARRALVNFECQSAPQLREAEVFTQPLSGLMAVSTVRPGPGARSSILPGFFNRTLMMLEWVELHREVLAR